VGPLGSEPATICPASIAPSNLSLGLLVVARFAQPLQVAQVIGPALGAADDVIREPMIADACAATSTLTPAMSTVLARHAPLLPVTRNRNLRSGRRHRNPFMSTTRPALPERNHPNTGERV
jgi:hypothetical protein